jgi:CBS domain-containing protein
MTRRDVYLDGMLRHLGAAYYESLHGRASAADVARARAAVEERLGEQSAAAPPAGPGAGQPAAQRPPGGGRHYGRWHTRVGDVMTTNVVSVDRITGYKQIADLLARHKISAVPVLIMGRHVAGVVSEADLLAARDQAARRSRESTGRLRWRPRGAARHPGLTAEQLMTSPAVTIGPDAPIAAAAKLMHTRHVKVLPVVAPGSHLPGIDGTLIGIVSRRDLLSVFLRPDAQIAAEVGDLLAEVLRTDPAGVTVAVDGGVVTLSGQPAPQDQHDLIPVAVRLIWDIDGVIDVVDKLSTAAPASRST